MTSSPRPLVEGALLAAVAVVLVLAGTYVPLFGPLLLLAWPLPIVVIFTRQGGRLAVLTVVVAGALLAGLIGPVAAMATCLVQGCLGLALGWAAARRRDATDSVLAGTVGLLGALLVSAGLSRMLFQENVLQTLQRRLGASLYQVVALYGRAGMPAGMLNQVRQSAAAMVTLVPLVLPALLVAAAAIYAFGAFLVACHVQRRLNQPVADLPPFADWQVPPWSLAGLAAGLACLYAYPRTGAVLWLEAGLNLTFLFGLPYLIQALAFAYFVGRHLRLGRGQIVIVLAVVAIVPMLNLLVLLAGLLDAVFGYRRLLKRRWEGGTT